MEIFTRASWRQVLLSLLPCRHYLFGSRWIALVVSVMPGACLRCWANNGSSETDRQSAWRRCLVSIILPFKAFNIQRQILKRKHSRDSMVNIMTHIMVWFTVSDHHKQNVSHLPQVDSKWLLIHHKDVTALMTFNSQNLYSPAENPNHP